MSKMIQIRNVPDDVHRALKARSALAGVSHSDLILEELYALVILPSVTDCDLKTKIPEFIGQCVHLQIR